MKGRLSSGQRTANVVLKMAPAQSPPQKSRLGNTWIWLAICLFVLVIPWSIYVSYHPSFSKLSMAVLPTIHMDIAAIFSSANSHSRNFSNYILPDVTEETFEAKRNEKHNAIITAAFASFKFLASPENSY